MIRKFIMKFFAWSCPVCGEEFNSRDEVKKHVEQHGTAEKISHLALGPNDWLLFYRTKCEEKVEEKIGLKGRVLLLLCLILFLYILFLSFMHLIPIIRG